MISPPKKRPNVKSSEDITRIEDLAPFDHLESESLSENQIETQIEISSPENRDENVPPVPKETKESEEYLLEEESTPSFEAEEKTQDDVSFLEPSDQFQDSLFSDDDHSKDEKSTKNDSEMLSERSKKKSQDYFQELKSEMESVQIEHVPLEGVPPFSMIISHIKKETDKLHIQNSLKKIGLYKDSVMANLLDRSIERGTVFISQINEYVANFLYQDLMKTQAHVYLNHSHLFENSSAHFENQQGESRATMQLNQTSQHDFEKDHDQIILSMDHKIPGHEILETIGPLIQTIWMDERSGDQFLVWPSIKQEIKLRKGNSLINWKVEQALTGIDQGKKILCTGIIVRTIKL
ncbi:MAG: hypothetical protein QE271_03445 [Bacteriovoracaceae bacterium]|nr:hypothetical protein [Bacteriovoracaceae bacterium]